jgi:hypothetical protein
MNYINDFKNIDIIVDEKGDLIVDFNDIEIGLATETANSRGNDNYVKIELAGDNK